MSLQLRMKHTCGLLQWNQWCRKKFISNGFYFLPKGFHIQFLNLTICPCSDTHAQLCSVHKNSCTQLLNPTVVVLFYMLKHIFVAEWRQILWRLCNGSHEIIRAWVGFPTLDHSTLSLISVQLLWGSRSPINNFPKNQILHIKLNLPNTQILKWQQGLEIIQWAHFMEWNPWCRWTM